MRSFKDYLAESALSHVFTIKFANEPTQEQTDTIAAWLKRYDLREIQKPQLIENSHKDFIDIPNRKVYEMKITLGMPISQYILLQDLTRAANISEKFMVVRSQNEPIEQYARYDVWSRQQDAEETASGMKPAARLSTDREYLQAEQPTVDPLFGNEYNKKLLSYLAGVADSRPSMNVEAPAELFSWLQMEDIAPGEPKQDTSDFNAHLDTPKPVETGELKEPVSTKMLTNNGTMSDNSKPVVKFYKDPTTGKAKQVLQPAENN
jgi:hypothetical protein